MATLYNSVLFYFYFGEKLSKVKILGMCFTVGCVVLLALDSSARSDEDVISLVDD